MLALTSSLTRCEHDKKSARFVSRPFRKKRETDPKTARFLRDRTQELALRYITVREYRRIFVRREMLLPSQYPVRSVNLARKKLAGVASYFLQTPKF